MTHPLTATDLHIAELLTGGVSAQRILAIGRHRRSWGPDDIAYVHAYLTDRAVEREVERERLAAEQQRDRPVKTRAGCGTTAGAQRHVRLAGCQLGERGPVGAGRSLPAGQGAHAAALASCSSNWAPRNSV